MRILLDIHIFTIHSVAALIANKDCAWMCAASSANESCWTNQRACDNVGRRPRMAERTGASGGGGGGRRRRSGRAMSTLRRGGVVAYIRLFVGGERAACCQSGSSITHARTREIQFNEMRCDVGWRGRPPNFGARARASTPTADADVQCDEDS